MTTLQIAQGQCANYKTGLCSGVTFDDALRPVRFRPEGSPCLIAEGQRCTHFENCVLGSSYGFESRSAPAAAQRSAEESVPVRRRLFRAGDLDAIGGGFGAFDRGGRAFSETW